MNIEHISSRLVCGSEFVTSRKLFGFPIKHCFYGVQEPFIFLKYTKSLKMYVIVVNQWTAQLWFSVYSPTRENNNQFEIFDVSFIGWIFPQLRTRI